MSRKRPQNSLMRTLVAFVALATLFILPATSLGTVTKITGSMSGNNGSSVGFATHGPWCVDLIFALPVLPANETISKATLSFQYTSLHTFNSAPAFNVDLYGLPARTTDTRLSTDTFSGSFGTNPNAAPIENDLISPSTPIGSITLSSDALVAYLNNERMKQPFTRSFIPLLLAPDYLFWSNHYIRLYEFYAYQSCTLTITSAEPTPEPAAGSLLLALAAVTTLRRGRRHPRRR